MLSDLADGSFFHMFYLMDSFVFQVVTGSEDGTARIWGEQCSQFKIVFPFVFGLNMAYLCSFSS
jgi:hypothetical protein